MSEARHGDNRSRLLTAALVVVGVAAGAGYFVWDRGRVERVEQAWLVATDGGPRVVVVERKSNPEYHDPYLLRFIDASSGEDLGRLEVGSSRPGQSPRLLGPAGERFAWAVSGAEDLRLVDLERGALVASDEALRQRLGGALRVPIQAEILDPAGRLLVEGADGERHALTTAQTVEPVPAAGLSDYYARCQPGLEALAAREKLHAPTMRACVELDGRWLGLVQHASVAVGEREWQATLFDASGAKLWTVAAAQFAEGAWFGHALALDDIVWLVVVEPGRFAASIHSVEIEPDTGHVRAVHELH